jgi:hypothetical protein
VLDGHKVYCGDSRDAATFQAVLGRERAQMVFTDLRTLHGDVTKNPALRKPASSAAQRVR